MTKILLMTLIPQLRKIAIKKRASHPSSIREPDSDFRKLVDNLEQADNTMKLEGTEILKLQYVNTIKTNTTHINNIHDSDVDLTEITYLRKIPISKVNHLSRYGVIIAEDTNVDKNNKITRTNHKSTKNQINHSINT